MKGSLPDSPKLMDALGNIKHVLTEKKIVLMKNEHNLEGTRDDAQVAYFLIEVQLVSLKRFFKY